jgi:hypothetical protein
MPMVGMKKFSYGKKGKMEAMAEAKKTGKKIVVRKPTKKTTKKVK